MSRLLESYLPPVNEDGIVTNKNATLGGTLGVTGAATLSSTLAVTGATTLSGAVTQKANFISGSGATVTLTAAQSGSTVLFDRAAGIVYTLPVPAVGMYFDFITTVTITSGAAEVDTDSGSTFILGVVANIVAAGTQTVFFANGTSHVKISSNGTTSGGIKGGQYRLTAVSSTLWNIEGTVAGSGTIVTPFA